MLATKEGLYTRSDFANDLESGGGVLPATSILDQARELALVCALALDSAAYDSPDDDELLCDVAKICSRLMVEAVRAIETADDLLAEL